MRAYRGSSHRLGRPQDQKASGAQLPLRRVIGTAYRSVAHAGAEKKILFEIASFIRGHGLW